MVDLLESAVLHNVNSKRDEELEAISQISKAEELIFKSLGGADIKGDLENGYVIMAEVIKGLFENVKVSLKE
jgi:hypothetical protein